MDAVDADVSKVREEFDFFSRSLRMSSSTNLDLNRPLSSSRLPTNYQQQQCFELERLINGELRELRAAAERAQASTAAWAASLAPLDDALRVAGRLGVVLRRRGQGGRGRRRGAVRFERIGGCDDERRNKSVG